MNLPNKLSTARICMIPAFILFFFLNVIPFNKSIAAIIFIIAATTDFLDGHIARSRGLVTNLGKFLDPIADKVLVSTAFVLMLTSYGLFGRFGYAYYVIGAISVCLILARELIISAFRQIAAADGIIMAAEKLGKYKTLFQDICIGTILISSELADVSVNFIHYFGLFAYIVGLIAFAIAVVLTVLSAYSYIAKNINVLKDAKK